MRPRQSSLLCRVLFCALTAISALDFPVEAVAASRFEHMGLNVPTAEGGARLRAFHGSAVANVGNTSEIAWGQRQFGDGGANYKLISSNIGSDRPLPEPAPVLLLGLGLGVIGFLSKRKQSLEKMSSNN